MIPRWLRAHPKVRLWLRGLSSLAVAALVGISAYQALTQGSRETQQVRHELQQDLTTVCDFVHGVGDAINIALDPKLAPPPSTAAGTAVRGALVGIQEKAQSVARSRVCVPRVSLTPTPPPTPSGRPSR